jgi:hypothetical protein
MNTCYWPIAVLGITPLQPTYLRLLAESTDVRIRSSGSRGASYEPWNNQERGLTSLREFVRDVRY